MNVLQTSLKRAGLRLEGDKLPKGQRKVADTQRLFAEMHIAETEMSDRISELERIRNEELREILELRERVRELEHEVIALRLKERMSGMDSLTVADRFKLLECANGN